MNDIDPLIAFLLVGAALAVVFIIKSQQSSGGGLNLTSTAIKVGAMLA